MLQLLFIGTINNLMTEMHQKSRTKSCICINAFLLPAVQDCIWYGIVEFNVPLDTV